MMQRNDLRPRRRPIERKDQMSKFYCHKCALLLNAYTPVVEPDSLNLTGSQYQLSKFLKHTTPVTCAGVVSVFYNSEYDKYKEFTVTTSASGSVEVDGQGRTNIIWYAGRDIGITYNDGRFMTTTDVVKVVLHNDNLKVHSFPVDSFRYETRKCMMCGNDILS